MARRQVGTDKNTVGDVEDGNAHKPKSTKSSNVPMMFVLLGVMGVLLYGVSVLTSGPATARPKATNAFHEMRQNIIQKRVEVPQEKPKAKPFKPPQQVPVIPPPPKETEEEKQERERILMQMRLTEMDNKDGIPVGYVRVPRVPKGKKHHDDGLLHIIFSSGCNYFQHWQSEFVLATAKYVGQRGRITRIVSGCHDKSAEKIGHSHQTFPKGMNDLLVGIKELNRSVNDNFGLFITPTFDGAMHFPWINKPSGIDYFIRHARPELDRMGETVIAILDPDFVFLEPLTQAPLDPEEMLNTLTANERGKNIVKKGRPVAQHYGLGGGWVTRFDVAHIAGKDSPANKYTPGEAAKHFAVGPPLMLHVDDLTDMGPLWTKNMREVLKVDKDILADMWAYCMAAAHLGLEHEILDQYMISTWSGHPAGEAFPWVNDYDNLSCDNPYQRHHKKPTFVHMASNFKAPENHVWMFHKGHVPAKILDCDQPLIITAPDDLWKQSKKKETKQRAWILCHIVSNLNRVVLDYREKFCPKGFEKRHLVKLIQDKSYDNGCNQMKDKWCYPLAQIEGIPRDWRRSGADVEN